MLIKLKVNEISDNNCFFKKKAVFAHIQLIHILNSNLE